MAAELAKDRSPDSVDVPITMKSLRQLALSLAALLFAPFASAEPLNVGADAPVVSGTTDSGATLNLGDVYKKNRYTLVYFYPRADTPGCTRQGCSLRDSYADLATKGVTVIGVSTDSVEAQRKFKEKYNFPFTLIADTDARIAKAFGQSAVKFASRQAYLVHNGKIVYADHNGSTTKQAEDILNFLAKSGT